ncbi:MAG: NADPH-dependent F420 reductase [Acidobacteriota bacterium]
MKKEIISIIGGTGDQGRGLALRWARAGYEIILGSRDSSRAQSVAAMLSQKLQLQTPSIKGADNREAAASGTIVVLTVPFAAQLPTLREIRDHLQPGALFVDVTVPLEPAVGGRPTRILGVWSGSAAEQSAETLNKDTRVVSAFQNVAASVLGDLDHQVDCDIIVCGNEKTDRERLQPLVEAINGCRYIDGGPLANSRYVEAWTALLIGVNIRYRTHTGVRITGIGS